MSNININGNSISIKNGSNVSIINGELYIDGNLTPFEGSIKGKTPVLNLTINGSINQLSSDGSINCDDIKGNVSSGGSINCDNIVGNVSSNGSINCDSISGSVVAKGSINY